MKKSKIINLLLFTVSFTATAKFAGNDDGNKKVPAITHPYIKSNGLENDKPASSIVRGGFGDKSHSGAEQNHDEKAQDITPR